MRKFRFPVVGEKKYQKSLEDKKLREKNMEIMGENKLPDKNDPQSDELSL